MPNMPVDHRHPYDIERVMDTMFEIRTAAGLTQQELADKVGLNRVYISRYESKVPKMRKLPSYTHLVMLHRVLCGLWLQNEIKAGRVHG